MNDIKPGVRSTEFWTTLISTAVTFAVALGLISSTDASNLADPIAKVIGAVAVIVVNGGIIWTYIKSRWALKGGNGNGGWPPILPK